MSLLLTLLSLFAVDTPLPSTQPQLNSSRYLNVVLKINGDPDLKRGHIGYWTALQTRPDWLEHEAVWWELMRSKDIGPLLVRVDELLQKYPESQTVYDRFYEVLAQDATLRQAMEQFERAALETRGESSAWLDAIEYLRVNPAAALPLLGGISPEAVLPDALKPYAVQLMRGADWTGLREPLDTLMEQPGARESLLPWWQRMAELDAQHNGLFSMLAKELLRKPNRFWLLYRRELALAENPALRDWVRWLHRRMRRETTAYTDYLLYLTALRAGQEKAPEAPAKAWPPGEAPPALEAIAESRLPEPLQAGAPKPATPEVARPALPEVARPQRPTAPAMRQSERMKTRQQ